MSLLRYDPPEIRCFALMEVVRLIDAHEPMLAESIFARAPRARQYAASGNLAWAPVREYADLLTAGQIVLGGERWRTLISTAARQILEKPLLGAVVRTTLKMTGMTPNGVFRVGETALDLALRGAGTFEARHTRNSKEAHFVWDSFPSVALPLIGTFHLVLRAWCEKLNTPAAVSLARDNDTACFTARW
jgi:hypothetical protein